MNFLSRSAKILTFLSLGLFFSQVLAQDACSENNLSGSSESANGTYVIGYAGVYSYQLWYDHGQSGSAKFYNEGAMSCSFSGVGDYLCRMGLQFNSDKTYDKLGGDIIAEFRLDKQNIQGVNYSYVGVYGWMEHVPGAPSQLVEYYVVDNTLANDMPGSWVGNEYFGDFEIDDGNYKVYRNTRNGPAIGGNDNKEFHQYFSIRKSPRTCGKINVSAHIKKWKELGMPDGDLYEAKVLGEAGCNGNGCGASGTASFPVAKVYISNGSTPSTSSSSTVNPGTSSSQVVMPAVSLPGVLQFENYQDMSGEDLTTYGTILGEIKPGDWTEYAVNFTEAGAFDYDLAAARGDDENRTTSITLVVDKDTVAEITGILTTGWNDFQSFTGYTSNIAAGEHTLRVVYTGGYVNVDSIVFTKRSETSSSSVVEQSSASIVPSSSSVVVQSSASIVPSSSSVVVQSSASIEPSSSSVVPPSSSAVVPSSSSEVPPSSSAVEPSSSSVLELSSATIVRSSSSRIRSSSSTIVRSSSSAVIRSSSSTIFAETSSSLEVSSASLFESSSSAILLSSSAMMALEKTQFTMDSGKDMQVFDMQGHFLGRIKDVKDINRPGVYLLKQDSRYVRIRVTR